MHALEEAPDEQGRYRRMGLGAAAVALLGVGMLFAAQHVAPMRRLRDSVIQMAVVTTPDAPVPLEPLPPPPPPPPEPPQAKVKPKPRPEPAPAEQAKTPPAPSEEQVGLDTTSFGEGAGGPAFHVGTTQMGTPTGAPIGGAPAATTAAPPGPPPKLVEARPIKGNPAPEYSDAARKANVEGLMVIEVSIDERGRVQGTRVRSGLHPELDAIAAKTVARWTFEPATLGGKSVASTKFLRIRFDLQ